MFEDEEVIYTKRYPSPRDEIKKAVAEESVANEGVEAAYQRFLDYMDGKRHYMPIPGRKEESQRFIALAKGFSEEYEIGVDIRQTAYAVEVRLYMDSSTYLSDMTRRFGELIAMCDRFSLRTFLTGQFDVVFHLDFYTHKHYLSGGG